MTTINLEPYEIDDLLTFLIFCEKKHPYYFKEARRLWLKIQNQQQTLFSSKDSGEDIKAVQSGTK